MNETLRNVFALLVGIVAGGLVNMGLVMVGPHVIAPPVGVDMSSVESLQLAKNSLEPQHFIFPFLAHSIGTFSGAMIAYFLAFQHNHKFVWTVGVFYLVGGISAAIMIPAPTWFILVDLVFAYLPAAWLAIKLGDKIHSLEPPEHLRRDNS